MVRCKRLILFELFPTGIILGELARRALGPVRGFGCRQFEQRSCQQLGTNGQRWTRLALHSQQVRCWIDRWASLFRVGWGRVDPNRPEGAAGEGVLIRFQPIENKKFENKNSAQHSGADTARRTHRKGWWWDFPLHSQDGLVLGRRRWQEGADNSGKLNASRGRSGAAQKPSKPRTFTLILF